MEQLLSRDELLVLIRQINTLDSEKDEDKLIQTIENGVLCPEISNYIFWSEMTPEEIVDKALAYKPICL